MVHGKEPFFALTLHYVPWLFSEVLTTLVLASRKDCGRMNSAAIDNMCWQKAKGEQKRTKRAFSSKQKLPVLFT
jgi:hypothetical protein